MPTLFLPFFLFVLKMRMSLAYFLPRSNAYARCVYCSINLKLKNYSADCPGGVYCSGVPPRVCYGVCACPLAETKVVCAGKCRAIVHLLQGFFGACRR